MCGRYAIIDGRKVLEAFGRLKVKDTAPLFASLPRYNASPMQKLPVFAVRHGELVVQEMQWWLVPHWSKDGKTNATTFNAKSETVAESRLFTPYFKGSRCLVPAEAFYEWRDGAGGRGGEHASERGAKDVKQPMCIRLKNQTPFMFAGLFSVWKDAEGKEFPSFAILTTEPNALMVEIHKRMPVILPEQHHEEWLDRENRNVDSLKKLLTPYDADSMEAYPVSRYVNNPRNEGEECLEELSSQH
jgi:putative SOS response-associated peptidase YedK